VCQPAGGDPALVRQILWHCRAAPRFAIGTPDLIRRIAAALGPWPCSGPALHIGAAALRDQPWADRTRSVLAEQAGKLDKVLVKGGFTIVGGTSLFRLAGVPMH